MTDKKNGGTTELHTFLPSDNSKNELTTKYKVQVIPKDVEVATALTDPNQYDPFAERDCETATTDGQTLTHLLKASLGTGILTMPFAFLNAGLAFSIIATVFVSLICTHCAYILVKCSHVLYHRTQTSRMSYAEVAETAFSTGPKWSQMFAVPSRYLVQICMFMAYFGTCSAYAVIIAKNFLEVFDYHVYGIVDGHYDSTLVNATVNIVNGPAEGANIRILIAILLLPLIFLVWVPNLKILAPISMVANLFMAISLGTTFYYIFQDVSHISQLPAVGEVKNLPVFFSLTIFALEAIGVIMPLENNMKTPQNFIGVFGVMNKGMSAVTVVYILLGILGYARYGAKTKELITSNLDIHQIPAQIVKILIGLAVYCTFGLQFFVCLDIVWVAIKDRFTKKPLLYNYILRTVLAISSVSVAIAIPQIAPLVGLLGAFCFSIMGIVVPIILEMIVFWDVGFGRYNWIIVKNIIIVIFGIGAIVFGSQSAIDDMVKTFSK